MLLDTKGYERGIDRLIRLRWIASAATMGAVAAAMLLGHVAPLVPALAVALLIPVTNVVHHRLARRANSARFLLLAQFFADLALLTALLGCVGGIDGPMIPLYLFHVLLATLYLSRRDALVVGGAAIGLMGVLALSQVVGAPFPLRGVSLYSTVLGLDRPLGDSAAFVLGQAAMTVLAASVALVLLIPVARDARDRGEGLERAEADARDRAAALDRILDGVGAMMMVLDNDHVLRWHNRAAGEKLKGLLEIGKERRCYDPAEPMGGAVPPKCPSCYTIETGQAWHGDYTLAVPGGVPRVLRFHTTPLVVGEQQGVVEVVLDVTEERMIEHQLLQARKTAAIAQLAAGVAHEMNTPLLSLAAGLRSLGRACHSVAATENGEWTRLTALVADLAAETARCQRVTESLLGYSREVRSRIEAVELSGIVDAAIADLSSRRDLAGIEVVHERPTDVVPPVHCDPDHLQVVLVNLMANAVDSLHEAQRTKARVHVGVTKTKEGGAEIRVTDNGVGVSRDVQERAFDPFFTTKRVGEGAGLGLALSRGLLEDMGADISLEGAPGKGAVATVRLPPAPPEMAVPAWAQAPTPGPKPGPAPVPAGENGGPSHG